MSLQVESAAAVLQRTPATLAALLGGLGPEWTQQREGEGSWSPFDVVGHLIDGEETDWIPRARIILQAAARPGAGSDPRADLAARRFEPFDRFRHLQRNRGRTLPELLERLQAARDESLRTLRGWRLSPAQLELPGEHPALGPVTLAQLLATWVVHDLDHLAQVSRVMAARYAAEVGPWAEYLPVLRAAHVQRPPAAAPP